MTKKADSRLDVLSALKTALKQKVGPKGSIHKDPYDSYVRGVRLPSLAVMHLLGNVSLRDCCTMIIDGEPSSSKSSLALDLFNWILPYGGMGGYIDAENKLAISIARGILNPIHLWHETHRVQFMTAVSIESAQRSVQSMIDLCRVVSDKIKNRDVQIPFLVVVDPLSGMPSEETIRHFLKQGGSSDPGHGGMREANLWTSWIRFLNSQIAEIPLIMVFVNHIKKRTEMAGPRTYVKTTNPGGIAQNYSAMLQLRCKALGKQVHPSASGSTGYQDIQIDAAKASFSPEWQSIIVRKWFQPRPEGTIFWWDWDRATVDLLAGFGVRHPSKDIVDVSKDGDSYASCKQLGLKNEDPSAVGAAIRKDEKIMNQLINFFCWQRLTEYSKLTKEEYEQLLTESNEAKSKFFEKTE